MFDWHREAVTSEKLIVIRASLRLTTQSTWSAKPAVGFCVLVVHVVAGTRVGKLIMRTHPPEF